MTESSLPAVSNHRVRLSFSELSTLQSDTVYLRDGELILYRRSRCSTSAVTSTAKYFLV